MKYLSILFLLVLTSNVLSAQSFTIDSLGLDGNGKILIRVTETDTLKDGNLEIRIFFGTKPVYRKQTIARIKDINRKIQRLQALIADIKTRRAAMRASFDILPGEEN